MDFAIGVGASALVAAAFALGNWWAGRRRLRKRYARMEGDNYTGWGFVDDEAHELVRKPEPQSEAAVKYISRSLLRIDVTHEERT